jgi:hypothetical protein
LPADWLSDPSFSDVATISVIAIEFQE